MSTRFTPDGDDIVVDGGKTFITNGDVADLLLLFGKWSEIDDAKAAISALVLEKGTPGFSVGRAEDKMGLRASSHRGARLRQLPRAARQPARQPGRRPEDPARLAQQVAAQHRRACARHRPRRLRGHGRLHQRAPAVGPPHRRVPGHPVHARRHGDRSRACARRGSSTWPTWSTAARTDFGVEASMPRCAPPTSRCASPPRPCSCTAATATARTTASSA